MTKKSRMFIIKSEIPPCLNLTVYNWIQVDKVQDSRMGSTGLLKIQVIRIN